MKYCIFRIILAVFLYSGLQAQNTEYWILQDTYALKKDANTFTPFGFYNLEYNNDVYTSIGEYIVNDSLYYIAEGKNIRNRMREPMLGWTDTLDFYLRTNPWFLGFNYSDTVLMVTEKRTLLSTIPNQSFLQCSYIWNRGDNNKGEIFKTVAIDSGPMFPTYNIPEGYGSYITPVRMADNENWWIITYKYSYPTTTFPNIPISSKLIVYGLTKDSIWANSQFDLLAQVSSNYGFGETFGLGYDCQSAFNYSTNKVYNINDDFVLYRYDFSRTNGLISGFLRDTLPGYYFQWNLNNMIQVSEFFVSQNGNYLYTLGVDSCRQFDLASLNPLLDMTIIPELCWEGFNNSPWISIYYPSGKLSKESSIYVFPVEGNNFTNNPYYHRGSYIARIAYPDLPYPACNVDTLYFDTGLKLRANFYINDTDNFTGITTSEFENYALSTIKITLVPNPAQTQATLTWSSVREGTFVLRDMLGRAVLSEQLNTPSGTTRLELSTLPKGIYLWQVLSTTITKNGKLMVE